MKKLSLFLVALTMVLVSCKPEQPKVVTTEVTEITGNSAVCGGGVSDGGGAAIVERGFCWNTERKPTVLDFCVKDTESGLGSFTLNIPNLAPNTQYYIRTYAVNANGVAGYGEEKSFTTLNPDYVYVETGKINGYAYVDLGLSVKWAACNVGANSPEEYGNYYAWGEVVTKTDYSSSNCPTSGLTTSQLRAQGYIDGEGNLTAQYDAACVNWGGKWRMPTKAEMQELEDKCTWTWTIQNGVKGYKVTGPNGNSIFLPAAGFRYGSSLYKAGSCGSYWSSTPDEDDLIAYSLDLYSDYHDMHYSSRDVGLSVRSILE